MVMRKVMQMDDEREPDQGQERLHYSTSPASPSYSQIHSEEPTTFATGPPSELNPSSSNEPHPYQAGRSYQDIENPWAQEPRDNSGNEIRLRETKPEVGGNSFIEGDSVVNNQTPPMNSEFQNGRLPAPSSVHQTPDSLGQEQIGPVQSATYTGKLQSNNPFLKAVQQNTGQHSGDPWGQSEQSSGNVEFQIGEGNTYNGDNLVSSTRGLSLEDDHSTGNSSYSQSSFPGSQHSEPSSWPPSTFDVANTTISQSGSLYPIPKKIPDHSNTLDGERPLPETKIPPYNNTSVPLINIESATPSSSRDLLELDGNEPGLTELEPPLPQQPQGLEDPPSNEQPHSESYVDQNLANESEILAPEPVMPAASPLSEAELARAKEKRSETYDIRHINWTDKTGVLRESPILIQNKNGPCPLLALVNGLVIRANLDTRAPIVRALRSREKISLGLLTEALFDELTSCHQPETQLPDIEALSGFLLMLHTGMNVNPKLTTEPNNPGRFLETNDIKLYSTFNLPLVHGWLASPSSAVHSALSRVAQYHEDIQLLQFRKEEMEDRVFRGGSLTQEEQQIIADIDTIQRFVDVENATQLSKFGLGHLERSLEPGSVSILFRNDHFTTLYKHPESGQLFTLVTDAGYASHAEIVWESLADVNGSNAELFSGDFRPVGHAPAPSRRQPPAAGHATRSSQDIIAETAAPGLPQDEQADADYAYALSLQFQDEEAQRENARNGRGGTNRRSAGPSHTPAPSRGSIHNRSSSSIAHRNQSSVSSRSGRMSSRPAQEVRPLIPPRVGSTDHGTTSIAADRPGDENVDPDAPPPTYEQAALSPVYNPPPDHPQYDGNSDVSPERLSNHRRDSGVDPFGPYSPSSSPPSGNGQGTIGRRPPGATAASIAEHRHRERERSKDCIVM